MSDSPKRPLDEMPEQTPALLQREFRVDRRSRPPLDPSRVPTDPDPSRVPTDPNREEAPAEGEFSPTALTPPLPGRAQPPSPAQWAQRPAPAAPPNLPPRRPAPVPAPIPPTSQPRTALPPAAAGPAAPWPPDRLPPRPAQRPLPAQLPQHLMVTLPGTPAAAPAHVHPPLAVASAPVPAAARAQAAPRTAAAPLAPPTAAPVPEPSRAAPAPASEVPSPAPGTVRATPAGLGRRLLAWVVDLALISLMCGSFLTVAMLVIAPRGVSLARGLSAVAVPGVLLLLVLAFVYAALFAFLFQGRTPGRGLTGIRLVDERGGAPGPARSLARAALSLLSVGLGLAGFWLALFDRRGQTLHDKLTRTFVVRLLDA